MFFGLVQALSQHISELEATIDQMKEQVVRWHCFFLLFVLFCSVFLFFVHLFACVCVCVCTPFSVASYVLHGYSCCCRREIFWFCCWTYLCFLIYCSSLLPVSFGKDDYNMFLGTFSETEWYCIMSPYELIACSSCLEDCMNILLKCKRKTFIDCLELCS